MTLNFDTIHKGCVMFNPSELRTLQCHPYDLIERIYIYSPNPCIACKGMDRALARAEATGHITAEQRAACFADSNPHQWPRSTQPPRRNMPASARLIEGMEASAQLYIPIPPALSHKVPLPPSHQPLCQIANRMHVAACICVERASERMLVRWPSLPHQ